MHLGPYFKWVKDLVRVIKVFFFFLVNITYIYIYLFTDLFNCFANAVLFFFLHL